MSLDPYHKAFEEVLDLQQFNFNRHCMAGMCLVHNNGCLILDDMAPSTSAAKIPRWQLRIKDAWLIKIGNKVVSTINKAQQVFEQLSANGVSSVPLLFSHPEIHQDILHDGQPMISSAPFTQQIHDHSNHQWDFSTVTEYLRKITLL
jgi:hypothetical protein